MTQSNSEYDGIVQVGEVPVVIRRDSPVESEHDQAYRSGAEAAFRQVFQFVDMAERSSPAYTDLRPYANLKTFVSDRITELGQASIGG